MFPILSRNQIKFIRSLKQKKYRDKFKNYLVEGVKQIADIAKHKPDAIDYIVVMDDFDGIPKNGHFDIYQVEMSIFKSLSNMIHSQGIMAVCRIPDTYFSDRWTEKEFALYFDGVQDPGNLGTMFRAAEWYGVGQVLIGPGTVDPYNPKVVQASMGSQSYLQIFQCDHLHISEMACEVIVADIDGEDAYDFNWPKDGLLVMGNEGQGLSPALRKNATNRITLRSAPGVRTESLNVSMACTALLTLRQTYFRGD